MGEGYLDVHAVVEGATPAEAAPLQPSVDGVSREKAVTIPRRRFAR